MGQLPSAVSVQTAFAHGSISPTQLVRTNKFNKCITINYSISKSIIKNNSTSVTIYSQQHAQHQRVIRRLPLNITVHKHVMFHVNALGVSGHSTSMQR